MISEKTKNHFKTTIVARSSYHENWFHDKCMTHTPKEEIDYCQNCTVPVRLCKGSCNACAACLDNPRICAAIAGKNFKLIGRA